MNENPNQPSPSGPEAWGPGGWHPYPGDYWAQPAQHSTAAYPPPPYGMAPSPQKRKQHTFLLAAALVAAGHTYREVADALFISPKTVQWNLSKIYRKLGVRSRAQLAAKLAAGQTPAVPPVPE